MIQIIRNAARCKKCDTIVESKSRHDLVRCKCGNVFVDGGREYTRMGVEDMKHYESLHEYKQEVPQVKNEEDGS